MGAARLRSRGCEAVEMRCTPRIWLAAVHPIRDVARTFAWRRFRCLLNPVRR